MDFEETKQLLAAQNFDLFILCHSLSLLKCERDLFMAHALRPNMKNLILTTALSNCSGQSGDTVLTASPVQRPSMPRRRY